MRKIIYLILIGAWIAFIFYNSLMPASLSSAQSMGLVRLFNQLLSKLGLSISLDTLSMVVRKLAHMFEFFVLSILVLLLFIECGFLTKKAVVFGLLATLLVASIDETIQLFVIGRYGSVVDVGIDMIGGVLGTLVVTFIEWIRRKRKEKKKA